MLTDFSEEEREFICSGSQSPICPYCLDINATIIISDCELSCSNCYEVFNIKVRKVFTYFTKKIIKGEKKRL